MKFLILKLPPFSRQVHDSILKGSVLSSKSSTYTVNWFRRFPRKLKNRVSRTVFKYDVF
jgi:hypothetical protein